MSELLFAPVDYSRYDSSDTLPARFEKLVDKMAESYGLKDAVNGKTTAIKMHVGRGVGYSTIHPLFVKILVDKLRSYGAKAYITDQIVTDAERRGYTQSLLGVPILACCAETGKYVYEVPMDFYTFKHCDIGGYIHDADVLIDLSHVKGHGVCGFGGAVKNIAMGVGTDRTRTELHELEGTIDFDKSKCTECKQCIDSCNHNANSFDENGEYKIFFHHCTSCKHCSKVCPTGAISQFDNHYQRFQDGMSLCTAKVLEGFDKGNVFYINFLTNITAICDCWGLTTPNLVPDIGVLAGTDIVAIEKATLDLIKYENFLPNGAPKGHDMNEREGHLFERLHGKNPYAQLPKLIELGMGEEQYNLTTIR